MTWDAVGALAELVGALAVIVTVAYLAVQVRQNTGTARSALQQAMFDSTLSVRLAVSQDPEFAQLILKANKAYESLAPEERLRFQMFAGGFLGMWSQAFAQHERSFVDMELWQSWEAGYRPLFNTPAMQKAWNESKDTFPLSFQRHVDGVG